MFCCVWFPVGLEFRLFLKDDLGANPVEHITHMTGTWALRFLVITLCVTPLRKLLGKPSLIKFRRMLGLFAFFYACLHFATYGWLYAWLEAQRSGIRSGPWSRPTSPSGRTSPSDSSGFCACCRWRVTSTAGWIRRHGRQALAVAASADLFFARSAGVMHYYWLVKSDVRKPLMYGAMVAMLLLFRAGAALWNVEASYFKTTGFKSVFCFLTPTGFGS